MGQRLVAVVRDDDALTRCQPVVLHDVRGSERVESSRHLLGRVADVGHGCGHPRLSHHVLRERLAALELSSLRRRTEAGDASGADGVGGARDERSLRPDDHELGAPGRGEVADGQRISEVDRQQLGQRPDPRVAGSAGELGDDRVLGEGSD